MDTVGAAETVGLALGVAWSDRREGRRPRTGGFRTKGDGSASDDASGSNANAADDDEEGGAGKGVDGTTAMANARMAPGVAGSTVGPSFPASAATTLASVTPPMASPAEPSPSLPLAEPPSPSVPVPSPATERVRATKTATASLVVGRDVGTCVEEKVVVGTGDGFDDGGGDDGGVGRRGVAK